MDLFPLPLWIFIPIRMVAWAARHWYISICVLALYFLDWEWFVPAVASLPVALFGYVWYHNRRHTSTAIARAALQLLRTRLAWGRACEAAELTDGPRRPRLTAPGRPVKIANAAGTALEFTINLARVGLTVKQLEDNRDFIAATLNARRTRVNRITPGIAKFTIEWEKKPLKSAIANPRDQINATQLPRVELDQDVLLELDTSLLVVGESGAGKSNITWTVLNELNKHGIPHRDYVIDPKKVELADLAEGPYTVRYSDSPSTADALIEVFYDDMMAAFERMKRDGVRKILIGADNPLRILIIDEMLLCKQAKQGIDSHLGEVLSAGRAAGFIVIGNSQLGQVDAISRLRDLFPQRICMAVKSADLTNAVLGPNAEQRGARCTEITEKGTGYIYTDHAGAFQRFRPDFIDNVAQVARGDVWTPPVTTKRSRLKVKTL